MLVDGGAVWENDRGDEKSLVRLEKYQTNEIVY
jgi:hypothetical protein